MSERNAQTIEISTGTIIKTIFLILGLVFLYMVREIVLLLLVSITLAAALEPLVAAAHRRLRFPRTLTVLLVYLVVVGLVGLFFYTLTPSFVEQFKALGTQYEQLGENLGGVSEFLNRVGLGDALQSFFQTFSGVAFGSFESTLGFFTGLLEIILIFVISFYLVAHEGAIKHTIRDILPEKSREKAVRVIVAIQNKLGRWLLGQVILSFTIFLVTYVALSLLNVKLALALAAVAGIFEIMPFVGPILSAIPAILIAFTQSPVLALIVAVLYVLIQKTEGYILVPKIMEKTVGVHPLLVLISILIGFQVAGILGALLAVPVVAAGSVIFDAYVIGRMPRVPAPADEVEVK